MDSWRKVDGVFVGAVDDEDLRALIDEAEDGGPRRASRAQNGDARALDLQALFQRANDPGHVGVEAVELAVSADAQRVAGADACGERVAMLARWGRISCLRGMVTATPASGSSRPT